MVDVEYILPDARLYALFDEEYERVLYTSPDHAFQDHSSNAFEIDRTAKKYKRNTFVTKKRILKNKNRSKAFQTRQRIVYLFRYFASCY